jgi:hypothetical protein
MKYFKGLLMFIVLTLLMISLGWAQAAKGTTQTAKSAPQTVKDKEINAYIDLMRKDLRKSKQSMVDEAMELDAAKKSQFWGIYAGYQTELDKIGDQRVENIKKYADNFDKMTDDIADQLAIKMMDLEAQRSALRNKYYKLFKEKMGARVAARFLQVEVSLACLFDLQLASEIPMLE